MAQDESDRRLSSISTLWSVVAAAHGGPGGAVQLAQELLLDRYGGAIRRYLTACLRDRDAADELFQEFAVAFIHGRFRNVDPRRGRFRDYVKTVLFHLVTNYHKQRLKSPQPFPPDHPEPSVEESVGADLDASFLGNWREELLARTWADLDRAEAAGGPSYATLLRFRAEHPTMGSPELADQFGARLGKPLTAAAIRQMLHRARQRFAEVLVEEVVQSLDGPTEADVEQELIDLGLFEYCRDALPGRGPS